MLKRLDALTNEVERKALAMVKAMPDADPDFVSSMVPGRPGARETAIEGLEADVGRTLPEGLRRMLAGYEVGGMEISGVVFGSNESLCEFLREQVQQSPSELWGIWQPVEDLFVIGSSAGYVLFVSVADGQVWACERDAPIDHRVVIALDVEALLRGLLTLVVTEDAGDGEALAAEIAGAVGSRSIEFWRNRVYGYE